MIVKRNINGIFNYTYKNVFKNKFCKKIKIFLKSFEKGKFNI